MASSSKPRVYLAKKTSLEELVFSRIDLSHEGRVITAMKKVTLVSKRYATIR